MATATLTRPKHNPLKLIRPKGCLTPHEAANRLGVVALTVRNWIRKGRLPAAKGENGYLWIRESDLKKFVDGTVKRLEFKLQNG